MSPATLLQVRGIEEEECNEEYLNLWESLLRMESSGGFGQEYSEVLIPTNEECVFLLWPESKSK